MNFVQLPVQLLAPLTRTLRDLYLVGKLRNFPRKELERLNNLESLNLNGHQLDARLGDYDFVTLRALKELYLEVCNITTNAAKNMLLRFHVDKNELGVLEFGTFAHARHLRELLLTRRTFARVAQILTARENKVKRISAQLLCALNDSKTLRHVHLAHNPWACDSSAQPLYTFVRGHYIRFPELEHVVCNDTHLAPLFKLAYNDFCAPDLRVDATLVLTFTSLSALSLLSITLTLCYYKYQLETKIWLYAHEHKLVPGLERGKSAFKVYIHARDWIVGAFIAEQITDSVEQSRRTIIVVSKHFMKSDWALQEFRMTHQRALNAGRERIITVAYGDLEHTEEMDQGSLAMNSTCNCTYNTKYESAKIDCKSANKRSALQVSIYEKTDVEIFCKPSGNAYPQIPTELLERLPRLGNMRTSHFLSVHKCVPFTQLLAHLALVRGNVLHIHGLGMIPLLTAQHFGQNLSYLQSVRDLELLAQPYESALRDAQVLDVNLFKEFSALCSLKIDLNFTQLPNQIFTPIAQTLTDLLLYGALDTFPGQALATLQRLNTLTMMNHRLENRLHEDDFLELDLIAHLTLHSCGITNLPARIFTPLNALKSLRLTANKLRTLPAALFIAQTCLQTLDLSRNQLQVLPPQLFHPSTRLLHLTLSQNQLRHISAQSLPPMQALVELNLAYNALQNIAGGSIAQAQRLEVLFLENNELNWTNAESCLALRGLRSLRILGLRHNNLQSLCNILDVTNSTTSHLQMLDMRYNRLTAVSAQLLRSINSSASMRDLYLSHNPWTCDCSAQLLHAFVKDNRARFRDMLEMHCNDAHLAPLAELSYHDFCLPDFGIDAAVVIIFTCLSLFTLVLITTALCYYKYKFQVQVWLYAHQLCLCCISELELDRDRKYDAFISYSHQDEHFVVHELLPGLEQGAHAFKVCIHVRDWLAGAFITEQIIDSVEQSRRTIIVLSQHYIHSDWARMEFRMAHQRALNEGRSRVIVLMYGDFVDMEQLDQELRAYLKMNTYLKWGDPWFWEKLRYAMPHSKRGLERVKSEKRRSDEIPLHAALSSARV
ncbi:toll-like receptor 13 [Eurosta solidaginis]|uniref:toll-like receptor 13 n=1 Tax=Eurosta solidaginis TaxID=178769 RepID=UPI003530C29F